MPTRTPLLRIHDMLESIRGIEKALGGKSYRDYQRSWVLRSAVERGIEVISEASRNLNRELKSRHKDVRWTDIAGIGNILRHEYQRIDDQIVWKAVKDDLPPLKEALLAIKASLEESE
ncbi:MAG: HepT-like ribonuclease domain-containing protein [Bradyrhizobium sp.]